MMNYFNHFLFSKDIDIKLLVSSERLVVIIFISIFFYFGMTEKTLFFLSIREIMNILISLFMKYKIKIKYRKLNDKKLERL